MPACLSETARARIDSAWCELRGLAALDELARMLDPDGTASKWALAGALSGRLRRFQATGYARIAKGYRPPRDRLEGLLVAVLKANLPTSQRNLHLLLN
jgi:hypothetical protein